MISIFKYLRTLKIRLCMRKQQREEKKRTVDKLAKEARIMRMERLFDEPLHRGGK